jgi:hypothetical protein
MLVFRSYSEFRSSLGADQRRVAALTVLTEGARALAAWGKGLRTRGGTAQTGEDRRP